MVSPPTHPNPAADLQRHELTAEATALARYGAAEEAIAQAGLALEDQQRQARSERREAQEQRREQAFERIDALEKAAKRQMVAELLPATAKAAQGLASTVAAAAGSSGGPSAQGGGGSAGGGAAGGASAGAAASAGGRTLLEGGLEIATSVLSHRAERARVDAEHHGVIVSQHDDQADSADETRDAAQSLHDRARSHLDAVSRARSEARLAALRG